MPKTKKAFERKYKDYSRRSLKYQFDIFVAAISEAVEYYMPEEFKGFLAELHDLRDKPDFYEDRIAGLPGTDQSIPEKNRARAMEFSQKWTNKILAKLDTENHPLAQFLKNEIAVCSPVYGDSLRAELSNPSLKTLRVGFGNGYKIFGEGNDGKPKIVANESAANLGDELRGLLNKHYDNVKNLYDLEFKRQKDIDNNLAKYNEKQYLSEYKKALQNLIQDHDAIVEFHKKNKDKEYTDALNNELSELTEVNSEYLREHLTSVKSGLKAQIIAIDHGWGADELGIIGTLGQIKGEIELQERFLREKKEDYAKMQDGPQKEEAKAKIEATERKINTFKEEFNPLYEECINADVTNNRQLKVDITNKITGFVNNHRKHICMYDISNSKRYVYGTDVSADSVLDPYGMKGLSKADQLKDFMDDLNAVDGTFQKSSANFKELRKRLEELNELAKKYPEKMNEEQLEEYLTKVEEVKAAGKKYLAGKKEEERLYKEAHNGEELPRKDITKRRIGFVTELESRLGLHMEHAFSNEFAIPEALPDDKKAILNEIEDGPLNKDVLNVYVLRYIMTEYKPSTNEYKNRMMEGAVNVLVQNLDLPEMDGAELKEYLVSGTEKGIIKDFAKEAEAPAEKIALAQFRYATEVARVEHVLNEFTRLDNETLVLEGNDGIGAVSKEKIKQIYEELGELQQYLNSVSETKTINGEIYSRLKEKALETLRVEQHDTLNNLSNLLEGYSFENLIQAVESLHPEKEYREILNKLRVFDTKKVNAEKDYFKTGLFPGDTLYEELSGIRDSLEAYFTGRPANEYSTMLRDEVTAELENLKNAGEFNAEMEKTSVAFREAINRADAEMAAEEEEKQKFSEGKLIDLQTDTVLKPEDKAADVLKTLMDKETTRRSDLINEMKNGEQKDAAFNKIIASACRSLYMEMLSKRYGNTEGMNPAEKEKNEKKLRYAIVHGFKDKENMKEFAEMLNVGWFGAYFKKALKETIENKGALEHDDILKARDVALMKEFSKAMPEVKPEEKKVDEKRRAGANRVSFNNKLNVNNQRKRISMRDKEQEADFARADNIRQLGKMLGSNILKDVNDITFPVKENDPKLKDIKIKTDYLENQKPEPRKIGMK